MDKKKHTKDGTQPVHFKNLPLEFRTNASLLGIFIVASLLVVIFTQFIVIPILGGWDPLDQPIPTYGTLDDQRAAWQQRTVAVKVKEDGTVKNEGTAFVMESVAENEYSDIYLVTAYHVVERDTGAVYLTHEGKEYQAQVVDVVENLDYALLRIRGDKIFVTPRASQATELSEIGVYGNGNGEGLCSKRGYISRREYESGDKFCFEISSDFTNQTVLHGMSGSPVFSANGIVGMLVEGTISGSMGYAVPYELIKNEYDRFRKDSGYKAIEYDTERDDDGNLTITLAGGDKIAYNGGRLCISVGGEWEAVISAGGELVGSLQEFLAIATDYDYLKQYFNTESNKTEFRLEVITLKNTLSVKVR